MNDGYFDEEGPGEHDQHLLDRGEGENDTMPCPNCGTELLAFADRCHACHADFGTEVWKAHGEGRWSPVFTAAIAIILVGIILMWLIR